MTAPPARIDKYELIRRLGHGGMGTVYLARDPDLDRLVAIKVLREPLLDGELLERFFREARAAAKLRHDNLITIYDVGQHDHQPFMAMEYVDGTTLASVIFERQPLPLVEKLSYIEQICSGLHHAHCEGIIHRDVKPANLMLDRHRVVRILDFGIARVEGSGMTQEGMMLGTLSYMAPEQMLGRAVDYRSDIYAVGAVAYELLAYQKAFNLEAELRPRLPSDAPLPLAECCPGLNPEIEAIVMRALAPRPEDRFADLDEVRAAVVMSAVESIRSFSSKRCCRDHSSRSPAALERSHRQERRLQPSSFRGRRLVVVTPTSSRRSRGLRLRERGHTGRCRHPTAARTFTWPRIALAASGMALLGAIVMGVSWWRAGDENASSSATPTETLAPAAGSPRVPTEDPPLLRWRRRSKRLRFPRLARRAAPPRLFKPVSTASPRPIAAAILRQPSSRLRRR